MGQGFQRSCIGLQNVCSLLCTICPLIGGKKEGSSHRAELIQCLVVREDSWRSVLEPLAAKVNSMCGTTKQIPSLRDMRSHKPRFRGTHSRGHGVIPYHERPFCPTSSCQLFRWVSACASPVATYFDCHLWPILTPNTNKPRCPSGLQRDELK